MAVAIAPISTAVTLLWPPMKLPSRCPRGTRCRQDAGRSSDLPTPVASMRLLVLPLLLPLLLLLLLLLPLLLLVLPFHLPAATYLVLLLVSLLLLLLLASGGGHGT